MVMYLGQLHITMQRGSFLNDVYQFFAITVPTLPARIIRTRTLGPL